MKDTSPKALKFQRTVKKGFRQGVVYISILIVLLFFIALLYRGGTHIAGLKAENIALVDLPTALFLSLMRMVVSYAFSLVFALVAGLVAGRTRLGEMILIPILDVLQSVPIVAFFPAVISFFIGISQGHRLGVELAACFLIFTCQAWNMAFAVYETIKGAPREKIDVAESFGLTPVQKFWKLYLPLCIPRLVYNSILSWSNGWFFLVAAEIIAVGPVKYNLPGIGSFLVKAAEQDQIQLVLWGLFALTLLIVALDFLVWRPATIWAEKFRQEYGTEEHDPMLNFWQISTALTRAMPKAILVKMRKLTRPYGPLFRSIQRIFSPIRNADPVGWLEKSSCKMSHWLFTKKPVTGAPSPWLGIFKVFFVGILAGCILYMVIQLSKYVRPPYPDLIFEIPGAILASTLRILITLLISFAWIVPLSLWLWNKPKLRTWFSTFAQIGAGLPAIALFPLFIWIIVENLGGGMEFAAILLLLTGMQWYLLFNCLGGTATIPSDIVEAARSFGLKRKQLWTKIALPSMRPSIVTGAITAWGGGWNSLVVAEYLVYKDQVMSVTGIGSLLNRAVYESGDMQSIVLCVTAMIGWIVLIDFLVWQRLYHYAIDRFRFET